MRVDRAMNEKQKKKNLIKHLTPKAIFSIKLNKHREMNRKKENSVFFSPTEHIKVKESDDDDNE